MVNQTNITINACPRGCHLITQEIEEQLGRLPKQGLLNLFVQHTSCALTINENADPSVRVDMNNIMDNLVPEGSSYYTHTLEGDDDMPAHVKSSLFNVSINIPISNHRLNLGMWQGIYFCEFRNYGGDRNLVATVIE